MQNKKWFLGMVTVACVGLMTASLWPLETGAAGDENHVYGQADNVVQGEQIVVREDEPGQTVGTLDVSLEQYQEEKQNEKKNEDNSVKKEETEVFPLYYAKTAVRLREEPNTRSDILIVIDSGEQVELLEEAGDNDWCLVRYQNLEGYLKYYHLKENTEEEWEYLGNYYITGYRMFSASENGGRSDGVTASGVVGTPGYTAAMKNLPFGTEIYVDGLGYYVVEDRGVGAECVDIACNTTSEAYELTGYRDVYIVN